MTLYSTIHENGANNWVFTYFLLNPSTGAHTIVATGNAFSSNTDASAVSYTGAAGFGAQNSTSDLSGQTSMTGTLTTTVDNSRVIMIAHTASNAISASTGATQRVYNATGRVGIYDNGGNKTPIGSVSETVTFSSDWCCYQIAEIQPELGVRYWVGGTASWSSSANWSQTSGGTSGVAYPTTQNVFLDGNSGGGTMTMDISATCNSLDFTGYTGTLAGSASLNISGSLTLVSGMTNSYTGAITFSSTSSGKTITFAGKTLASAVTFNGSGGVWTLQDSLTSTSSVTNTVGTVILNNLSHSVSSFSNAGTVTMGSGTLTLTGTGTVWNGGGAVTAGTSVIKINNASSSSKTFAGGGLTYNNLYLTGAGTGTFIISGSNTFSDFKCDTPPHTIQFTAGTTQTLNTFTVSGTAGNLMTLQSTSNGHPWYLVKSPAGTVSSDYLSLQDSHVS